MSEVFVIGPYHGGGFSTGMDSVDDLKRLPLAYPASILTNEIERAEKWVQSRR